MNDIEIVDYVLQELERGIILSTDSQRQEFMCKILVERLREKEKKHYLDNFEKIESRGCNGPIRLASFLNRIR